MLEQSLVAAIEYSKMRHETEDDHVGSWQFNWPVGTRRTVLSHTAGAGAFFLLELPAGYMRLEERANTDRSEHRFEWHSCHEEIFCLDGEIRFGAYYTLSALGYLNHPPHWVHPADQHTDIGATLLIRNSGPVDFRYEPVPDGWDGVEYVSRDHASYGESLAGVTVQILDPPLADKAPVVDTLYRWNDGLVTQLVSVPPGWLGPTGTGHVEMVFVVDGDLSVGGKALERWGYSAHHADGDHLLASTSGARMILWAR